MGNYIGFENLHPFTFDRGKKKALNLDLELQHKCEECSNILPKNDNDHNICDNCAQKFAYEIFLDNEDDNAEELECISNSKLSK